MKLLGCVSKIVSKKQLLLLLDLVCLAPAFASDNGGVVESKGGARDEAAAQAPVDAWGAVEERVGSPRVAAGAGAGSETIELKIGDKTLVIPQVDFNQFEMLRELISVYSSNVVELPENEICTIENLRVLLDLVQNQRAEDYSLEELVDAVLLADYLLINDRQILGENLFERLSRQLKVQASPELAMRIKNINSVLHLPLQLTALAIQRLEDISCINWSPDGSGYWVYFLDGRAIRYDKNGEQQGDALRSAAYNDAGWAPKDLGYWVRFAAVGSEPLRIVRYNKDGVPQGAPLASATSITWNPNGSGYWVRFVGGVAIKYNQAGEQQGEPLVDVTEIDWSPDGASCWVRFKNQNAWAKDIAIKYSQDGMPQDVRLEEVEGITWHPKGAGYWVRFMNNIADNYTKLAIRYNQSDEQQGEPLENVVDIAWSPDGSSYWVKFDNDTAIRYNQAGVQQGEALEQVNYVCWNSDGSGYWVFFIDYTTRRYNQAGLQQGEPLAGILHISWNPDGSSYWLRFLDSTAEYYLTFNSLPLYEQVLVQYVINHKNSTGKTARLAKKYLKLLSPDTLKRLQSAGYLELFYQVGDYVGWFDINDAGVGAGVVAGVGASGSKDLDHDQVD